MVGTSIATAFGTAAATRPQTSHTRASSNAGFDPRLARHLLVAKRGVAPDDARHPQPDGRMATIRPRQMAVLAYVSVSVTTGRPAAAVASLQRVNFGAVPEVGWMSVRAAL
jgi:hypothetical protein